MKKFSKHIVSLLVFASLITAMPSISNEISSIGQAQVTKGQSLSFNVTVLNNEILHLDNNTLGHIARPLAVDKINQMLYVGTYIGLSVINLTNQDVKNITMNEGLSGNNTSSLAIDSSHHQAYIGFNGGYGLSVYNWTNEKVSNLSVTGAAPTPIFTMSLAYDFKGLLYAGTDGQGLYIYNLTDNTVDTKNISHGLPSNQLYSLELDYNRNVLYIGSLAGLAIYDIVNDTIKVKTSNDGLAEDHVYALKYDDNRQLLYVGMWDTRISIYDLKNKTFSNYDTGDSNSGDAVSGLALDDANNLLYVGTSWDGIHVFDISNRKFIQHINQTDGLPSKEGAPLLWDTHNNNLYIGSLNGLSILQFHYPTIPEINELPLLSSDGKFIISWFPSINATSYIVQESNESTFSTPQLFFTNSSTSISRPERQNGTYYYRVRASNGYGNSAWSETKSIKVVHPSAAPMIEPILLPDVDGNYTVKWSEILDASNYTLEESHYSTFNSSTVIYTGINTTFDVNNKSDGVLFYRVKAINEGGESGWSTTSVTVYHLPSIPVINKLSSPDDNGNYNIFWSSVTNADYFLLEESSSFNFTEASIVYIGFNNYTEVINKPDGDYYYRVRAINKVGQSNWSDAQKITVSISPVNHSDLNIYTWLITVTLIILIASIVIYFFSKKRK